jgi:hypothetical protein
MTAILHQAAHMRPKAAMTRMPALQIAAILHQAARMPPKAVPQVSYAIRKMANAWNARLEILKIVIALRLSIIV